MKNKNHTHIFDENGKQICCSLEEKIDGQTPPPLLKQEHSEDDGHDHSHDGESTWNNYIPAIVSLVLLLSGIAFDYYDVAFFQGWIRIMWYVIAYIPVGRPVLKEAIQALTKGEIFTEFFLMSIATIGAVAIG